MEKPMLSLLSNSTLYYIRFNLSIDAITIATNYNYTNQTEKLNGTYESVFLNDLKLFEYKGNKTQLKTYNATKFYRVYTKQVMKFFKKFI